MFAVSTYKRLHFVLEIWKLLIVRLFALCGKILVFKPCIVLYCFFFLFGISLFHTVLLVSLKLKIEDVCFREDITSIIYSSYFHSVCGSVWYCFHFICVLDNIFPVLPSYFFYVFKMKLRILIDWFTFCWSKKNCPDFNLVLFLDDRYLSCNVNSIYSNKHQVLAFRSSYVFQNQTCTLAMCNHKT